MPPAVRPTERADPLRCWRERIGGRVSAEAVGERASSGGPFDRDIRWLFTFGGIATATILPFFSPLLQSWGITPDRIGLILSAQALAAVVAAPLWSHEADTRWGTTRTLVASTLATAACAGLLILVGVDVWVVGVVAAMMAAAGAPGTALGDALALGVLGRNRTNDYGRIRRFASGGWAVAVVLVGALYQRVGLEPVLPLYIATLLGYAAFARRFPSPVAERLGPRASRLGSIERPSGSPRRCCPSWWGSWCSRSPRRRPTGSSHSGCSGWAGGRS